MCIRDRGNGACLIIRRGGSPACESAGGTPCLLYTSRERIGSYMNEVNKELWKLGVPAKTQHNEAAPSQHELAPIYEEVNLAVDHNQIVMETLKKVAGRHGMACPLHEKPFAGVNGSGKHDNWSLTGDDGTNMLNPGDTPHAVSYTHLSSAPSSIVFFSFL